MAPANVAWNLTFLNILCALSLAGTLAALGTVTVGTGSFAIKLFHKKISLQHAQRKKSGWLSFYSPEDSLTSLWASGFLGSNDAGPLHKITSGFSKDLSLSFL